MKFKKAKKFIDSCPMFDDSALGLAGEVGEVIELIKKDRRPDDRRQVMDKEKLALECYDVFFYLTRVLSQYDIDWNTAVKAGEDKLTKRFNNG
jgi:NTP pyrophosphatase (non-canonical NTP hydrolase)